jgi:hypothetical protein
MGNPLQQVSGVGEAFREAVMDPAALPAAALQHPPDCVGEAHVGVTDHQLDPSEAAFFEGSDELAPQALGLTVTHFEAQQLAAAVGIDAHDGHHHGPRADLQGLAQPPMEIRRVEIDVGVAGLL